MVLYGTTDGHTRKIALALAGVLKWEGNCVDVIDTKHVSPDVRPEGYDGVVIAGSIHIGNFQRAAAATQDLATLEDARASAEQQRFDKARKDALRYLILASILAGVFVAILLATAVDLARSAERALGKPS